MEGERGSSKEVKQACSPAWEVKMRHLWLEDIYLCEPHFSCP